MPTHYEVLGIPATASPDEVRHAYRRLVKTAHPDRAGDPARFELITEAYAVLSDPTRRAAYDRGLRPPPGAAPAPQAAPAARPAAPRHYGRYVALLVAVVVIGGVAWLVVATSRQSVGDRCLVGRWRGEAFEVPFQGSLDGTNVAAPIRGGAGVLLTVGSDGTVRADYRDATPLVGMDGAYRIEGVYSGRTIERWQAGDRRVTQTGTDASGLRFQATINGRQPDAPLAVTVLDGAYPYTCTATTLDVGPYRYERG